MRCARAVASEEENPPTPRARISPSATNPRQDRLRQLGHAHAQFQITIEAAPEKWEKSISPALRDGIQIWHQLLQAQFPLDLGWEGGRGMVDATPQALFSQLLSLRRPASAEIEMLARRHFGARPGNFLFRHRREPFFRSRSNLSPLVGASAGRFQGTWDGVQALHRVSSTETSVYTRIDLSLDVFAVNPTGARNANCRASFLLRLNTSRLRTILLGTSSGFLTSCARTCVCRHCDCDSPMLRQPSVSCSTKGTLR